MHRMYAVSKHGGGKLMVEASSAISAVRLALRHGVFGADLQDYGEARRKRPSGVLCVQKSLWQAKKD